jgi:CheY-like chemotaxis protein
MKKVLVVEDDAFIRDISTIKLTEHGCSVTAVVNGAEALEALSKDSFDVILLDMELPDLSGLEILKQVRANLALTKLPVIVFSNRSDSTFKDEATALGILGYFVKASTEYSEIFALIDPL